MRGKSKILKYDQLLAQKATFDNFATQKAPKIFWEIFLQKLLIEMQ